MDTKDKVTCDAPDKFDLKIEPRTLENNVDDILDSADLSILPEEDRKELEKDKEEIKEDAKELAETINKAIKDQVEKENKYRKMMEEDLLVKASEAESEEEKERYVEISQAYTDGYQYLPLIDFMNEEYFKKKYHRYVKSTRFRTLSTDFDHKLSMLDPNCKMDTLVKVLTSTKNFVFENDDIDKLIIGLGLFAREKVLNNGRVGPRWFLYNAYKNIIYLCTIPKPLSDFDREKVKFFVNLFTMI